MKFIGIDYSLNSPAICSYDEKSNEYWFTSLSHNKKDCLDKKKISQGLIHHKNLFGLHGVDVMFYDRLGNSKDYITEQNNKIKDAVNVATLISTYLEKNSVVGLEGFSYGSKGNSFIDIIFANAILREYIYSMKTSKWLLEGPLVFTPSEIKKLAGKGNANKLLMYKYFLEKGPSDTEFYKYVKSLDIEENVPKPIDDLIDAYWIEECTRQYWYRETKCSVTPLVSI